MINPTATVRHRHVRARAGIDRSPRPARRGPATCRMTVCQRATTIRVRVAGPTRWTSTCAVTHYGRRAGRRGGDPRRR